MKPSAATVTPVGTEQRGGARLKTIRFTRRASTGETFVYSFEVPDRVVLAEIRSRGEMMRPWERSVAWCLFALDWEVGH